MGTIGLLTSALAASTAWACAGKAAGGCAHGGGCGTLGGALLAAIAALGYWTLSRAEKDSGAAKRAGQATGWVLVVVGLLGFLCASASHIAKNSGRSSCHAQESAAAYPDVMRMPPGHPPLEGMAEGKKGAK